MLGLAIVLATSAFFQNPVPSELNAYIRKADKSFAWHEVPPILGHKTLALVSQTWHGLPWRHSVVFSKPSRVVVRDTAIIYITGDDPDAADEKDADTMSRESGLPVATLYDIPVQPINGLQEDELIASTFEKFLKSGDASDLLLWPMAKSVIRAMDALKARSHGRLKKFVLWGESKRAWTAWMAAATGDKRIVGLAPCSFDNLNIPAQMKHQKKLWGHYSPAIEAYSSRGLQASLDTPRGKALAELIDPYNYLRQIKARIITIRGTNDPYWALDAYAQYVGRMPRSATMLALPNEGHDFKDKGVYLSTVGAFAASCAVDGAWPMSPDSDSQPWAAMVGPIRWIKTEGLVSYAPNPDFSMAAWELVRLVKSAGRFHAKGSTYLLKPELFPGEANRYEGRFDFVHYSVHVNGKWLKIALSSAPAIEDRSESANESVAKFPPQPRSRSRREH